jgi:hypothetical protein
MVTEMGAVKVVSVVVGEVSAVKWKTSVVAERVPVGSEVDAKKATGSSLSAWKVVVAMVVVENSGGMLRVMALRVTVLVAVVEAFVAVEEVVEARPVQESVVNVALGLVVVLVSEAERTR